MKNELGLKIIKKFDLDKKLLCFSKEKKIAGQLNTLHSRVGQEKWLYKKYLAKKLEYMLLIFLCTMVLIFVAWFMPGEKGQITDGMILRNGYGGVEKSIILVAESEGMKAEFEFLLEPKHYTKTQLDKMSEEAFVHLEAMIFVNAKRNEFGEYEICKSLMFPSKMEGYPFSVSWESSNYNVLDSDGTIGKEVLLTGEKVNVTAKLSCYEYVFEKEYSLKVFPKTREWKDDFSEVIKNTIEELDENTSENESFLLPTEIEGHAIRYEEKKETLWEILPVLGCIMMIYIWFSMDSTLNKKMEERNHQLLGDYAKFVSKMSLYLGAGLSMGTAVKKITDITDKDRFYVKELEIALREMENHISENKAMENYANRCKLPCYIKLSVLINQNIKKGNNNLQKQLKEETKKAFEERENLAKKYAQEAGTKLLFPMLLMLIVVMVMIMYPAFISFTI